MIGSPLAGPVSVEIEFGWTRMDLDSCLKSILDTLQGIAYVNDKQVTRIVLSRIPAPEINIKIV
jgi:Holliday junction resolvase RusA-like endonuclease